MRQKFCSATGFLLWNSASPQVHSNGMDWSLWTHEPNMFFFLLSYFSWAFLMVKKKVPNRKLVPEKWDLCCDYLIMWFRNLCKWFVEGIWNHLAKWAR
jgi:F0F1-type ATP synthase membrane subunit a